MVIGAKRNTGQGERVIISCINVTTFPFTEGSWLLYPTAVCGCLRLGIPSVRERIAT